VIALNAEREFRVCFCTPCDEKDAMASYIAVMGKVLLVVSLVSLLTLSIWFAAEAWIHIGGDAIPGYGYVAIAGGVLISLLVGGGLMALVFYSNRHGYDDLSGGDN
jgi:uncharacterized membrane protein